MSPVSLSLQLRVRSSQVRVLSVDGRLRSRRRRCSRVGSATMTPAHGVVCSGPRSKIARNALVSSLLIEENATRQTHCKTRDDWTRAACKQRRVSCETTLRSSTRQAYQERTKQADRSRRRVRASLAVPAPREGRTRLSRRLSQALGPRRIGIRGKLSTPIQPVPDTHACIPREASAAGQTLTAVAQPSRTGAAKKTWIRRR